MNLIEALKSGKRIRQKSKEIWLEPKQGKYFSIDHILSDDWEVEPEPVTVTEYQFYNAYAKALNKAMTSFGGISAPSQEALADIDRIWKEVAEELWFQLNNKI